MKPRLGWALLLVVAVSPLWARVGIISGTVRDSRGVPQLGAAIAVFAPSTSAPVMVYTDSRGRYSAPDLAPGRYQVKASAASFLPTLRQNVVLRSGATVVVNLTLNTLFEAIEMLPLKSRTVSSDDDWKWTLRSMADRPILRVLDGSPVMVVSRAAGEGDHALKAQVAFLAGSPGDGLGTSDDRATQFSVQSSIFSAGTLDVNGGMGSTFGSPAVLHVSYSHQLSSGEKPQISVTARRFRIETAGSNNSELDALSVSASDLVRLTDFAELDYGTEYQTIQFLGRAAAFRPYGTLDVHVSPNTVVEYRYASALPDSRLERGFDSAPADLSESGPRMSMAGNAARLESGHHQEVSISERAGKNAFQLAGFTDRLENAALIGVGDDAADDASGRFLADPYSQTFTYFGGGLSTGGVRAVAQRKISSALTGTLDLSYGGVLALAENQSLAAISGAPPEFAHARRAALSAKLAGKVACTRTSWIASYKWTSGPGALTQVDAFNASAGQAEPYLSFFIRQPLPAPGFIPGQVEALVDIRNLLAQGYVPVIGQDGHTLYLVQAARSVRGGLAFNF